MNTSQRSVRLRATVLAVVATATLLGLVALLAPGIDLGPDQPFAGLLTQCCTVVLLGCAAWAWLVTVVVLRPVYVFPFKWLQHRFMEAEGRFRPSAAAVISWAGMRGVVTLAAVSLARRQPRVTVTRTVEPAGATGTAVPATPVLDGTVSNHDGDICITGTVRF